MVLNESSILDVVKKVKMSLATNGDYEIGLYNINDFVKC